MSISNYAKSFSTVALTLVFIAAAECQSPAPDTKGGVKMIQVPAGEFMMGSDKGAANEKPVHKVKLDAFFMDQTLVTQAEYERLMGRNPARAQDLKNPVEMIRWADAARYCNARSKEDGLEPCYTEKSWLCDFSRNGYRLPTEAEWEYACRAGTSSEYFFGDNPNMLQLYAWHKRNSGGHPHAAGIKKPNPWGLYDMGGNVFQWCNDFYSPDYYAKSPADNPKGLAKSDFKVLRGGCFSSDAAACRPAARHSDSPAFADACAGFDTYGFRCVRAAEPQPQK